MFCTSFYYIMLRIILVDWMTLTNFSYQTFFRNSFNAHDVGKGPFTNYIEKSLAFFDHLPGYALEIWICGCSLFYKRELWASKSAGAHSTKILNISGCKRWCPKHLWDRAPATPVLTHSLQYCFLLKNQIS